MSPTKNPSAALPKIAVGLLSHNRAADVLATLEVVMLSNYPPDKLHPVVIDNASTDGTNEWVRQRFGHRVEMLELPENIGSVARNRLMLGRDEKYLFIFDEDCQPEYDGTLRAAVEFMEANPYFGALCFRSINQATGRTEYGDFSQRARRRLDGGHVSEGVFVVGNGMCFRRDAIRLTRGYDERMFWGSEEYSLALEMLYRDVPIAYRPDLALIHRRSPRAMTSARVAESEARNNIWIVFTYFPLPVAIVAAALHTLRRIAMPVLRGRPENSAAAVRGALAALAGLGDYLVERRTIPVGKLAANNRWFVHLFFTLRGLTQPQSTG